MNRKQKIAVYTRVSTDGQAEIEFNSCEAQEAKIKAFISSQVDMEIVRSYSDPGYSGATLDRPALQEMLADIEQGEIDAVVAYKIDRLTRSPRDFYQLIEVLEKHDASFISVTERFDTSTPAGRLLRNIMLTFAQFERELISERTRDKMIERAKKGLWNSGFTPFGYKRENKHLIVNEDEASIVRRIFRVYSETGSTAEVYKNLKAQKLFNRKGIPTSITEIAKILQRVVYIGQILYGGNVYKGVHEPIISESLFASIQKMHKTRVKKSKVFNYSLLQGLVRCKECGSFMTPTFTNKVKRGRRTRYFYYMCSSVLKRDKDFCSTKRVSAERLDELVMQGLARTMNDAVYLESLIFMLNHKREAAPKGFEPRGSTSPLSPEIVRRSLEAVTESSRLKNQAQKVFIIKKFINKVIYSKETVEVVLNYPDSRGENLPNSPKAASQNVLPADGVWVGANAVRRTTATKAKTADLKNPTVSSYILAGPKGFEPSIFCVTGRRVRPGYTTGPGQRLFYLKLSK